MAEEKKVLLSINDLWVKFRVRGRVLTAIRGVSLDIYENESIAIVGESGSGKSVFTKTFAGMLDSNGFIDNGSIIFNDEELADTHVRLTPVAHRLIGKALHKLNEASKLEAGADVYQKILELEAEKRRKTSLSDEEKAAAEAEYKDLVAKRTDAFNLKQTFDPAHEKDKIRETAKLIKDLDGQIKAFKKKEEQLAHDRKAAAANDAAFNKKYQEQSAALKEQYQKAIAGEISPAKVKRNEILAKEIYLSVGRYGIYERVKMVNKLLNAQEMRLKRLHASGDSLRPTGGSIYLNRRSEGHDLSDREVAVILEAVTRDALAGRWGQVDWLDSQGRRSGGTYAMDLNLEFRAEVQQRDLVSRDWIDIRVRPEMTATTACLLELGLVTNEDLVTRAELYPEEYGSSAAADPAPAETVYPETTFETVVMGGAG